jgi:cytochrome c5
VSKQDDHFFNVFSAVLGILVAITLFLFVLAKFFGGGMTRQHVASDPILQAEVAERVRGFGQLAIAGQDNSALSIAPPPGAAAAATTAAALPANGEEVYRAVCTVCHGPGIAGAPKSGDRAAWAPRIAQGNEILYKHSIEGFQGSAGVMPARGGRADLTDELVKEAVDYMVAQAR